MNYQGTIIQESLGDPSVLTDTNVLATRVETVTEKHKTPWLSQWTLHTVEIAEEKATVFAQKISQSFDPNHPDWYVDFKNDLYHYIIFPNKIFKVDLANLVLYKEAKTYGISLGIPDYQLNFSPEI
ncbi:hypothetical protein HY086_05900 [Candidatus Gottesmanbacteria bacterium]|nr:hypothetical protein [Candidatus Gottesmanbacteria bacterium]